MGRSKEINVRQCKFKDIFILCDVFVKVCQLCDGLHYD